MRIFQLLGNLVARFLVKILEKMFLVKKPKAK